MPAAMSPARSTARSLRAVQTPQAFAFPALLEAHRRAAKEGREDFTDDAALAEWAGIKVATFAGESGNVKLTTDEDFAKAEARRIASLADLRLGNGFDVHAFGDGDHVWLGGIKIPHDRGLTGHSDADVALHALVDAILGALADGDIGEHFSPNDPRWRGASSDQFLTFAVERVSKRGGRIAHLDVTIVCEAPRIGPHRDAMRKRIAEIADMSIERVAVKATTSEQLGFTGRREGIAAMATATVRLPWSWYGWHDRRRREAAATALLDLCKAQEAHGGDGGILHRRPRGRRADRHRRLLGRGRSRLRHLHQRGQAADARRAGATR